MLTLFSVPKPFSGQIERLQRNALRTWTSIEGIEVLLFGDEPGTANAAADAGVSHEPQVARTAAGTPRVDDLFARAEQAAANELLCFVNADVLLPQSLPRVVARARGECGRFVGLGQCLDLEVGDPLPDDWEAVGRTRGSLRGPGGIDYLIFARCLFGPLPPFALGRAYFDNWLVWRARSLGVAVVDLTEVLPAVHQRHEYGHVAGGKVEAYAGPEALANLRLAGGRLHLYNVDDATHRLTADGLRRNPYAYLRGLAPARWLALSTGRLWRSFRRRASPLA